MILQTGYWQYIIEKREMELVLFNKVVHMNSWHGSGWYWVGYDLQRRDDEWVECWSIMTAQELSRYLIGVRDQAMTRMQQAERIRQEETPWGKVLPLSRSSYQ